MNPRIKSAVNQHPILSIKLNKGMRHRIMKIGIGGSLWVTPQTSCFWLVITGEVDSILYGVIKRRNGEYEGEDQGHKYWHISRIEEIEEIIHIFGK